MFRKTTSKTSTSQNPQRHQQHISPVVSMVASQCSSYPTVTSSSYMVPVMTTQLSTTQRDMPMEHTENMIRPSSEITDDHKKVKIKKRISFLRNVSSLNVSVEDSGNNQSPQSPNYMAPTASSQQNQRRRFPGVSPSSPGPSTSPSGHHSASFGFRGSSGDNEARLRQSRMECEQLKAVLGNTSNECEKLSAQVRQVEELKSICHRLEAEMTTVRRRQKADDEYLQRISQLEHENMILRENIQTLTNKLTSFETHISSQNELSEKLNQLETQNQTLLVAMESQRTHYERFVDHIATQVIQTIVNQKNFKTDNADLHNRIHTLERQNQYLLHLIRTHLGSPSTSPTPIDHRHPINPLLQAVNITPSPHHNHLPSQCKTLEENGLANRYRSASDEPGPSISCYNNSKHHHHSHHHRHRRQTTLTSFTTPAPLSSSPKENPVISSRTPMRKSSTPIRGSRDSLGSPNRSRQPSQIPIPVDRITPRQSLQSLGSSSLDRLDRRASFSRSSSSLSTHFHPSHLHTPHHDSASKSCSNLQHTQTKTSTYTPDTTTAEGIPTENASPLSSPFQETPTNDPSLSQIKASNSEKKISSSHEHIHVSFESKAHPSYQKLRAQSYSPQHQQLRHKNETGEIISFDLSSSASPGNNNGNTDSNSSITPRLNVERSSSNSSSCLPNQMSSELKTALDTSNQPSALPPTSKNPSGGSISNTTSSPPSPPQPSSSFSKDDGYSSMSCDGNVASPLTSRRELSTVGEHRIEEDSNSPSASSKTFQTKSPSSSRLHQLQQTSMENSVSSDVSTVSAVSASSLELTMSLAGAPMSLNSVTESVTPRPSCPLPPDQLRDLRHNFEAVIMERWNISNGSASTSAVGGIEKKEASPSTLVSKKQPRCLPTFDLDDRDDSKEMIRSLMDSSDNSQLRSNDRITTKEQIEYMASLIRMDPNCVYKDHKTRYLSSARKNEKNGVGHVGASVDLETYTTQRHLIAQQRQNNRVATEHVYSDTELMTDRFTITSGSETDSPGEDERIHGTGHSITSHQPPSTNTSNTNTSQKPPVSVNAQTQPNHPTPSSRIPAPSPARFHPSGRNHCDNSPTTNSSNFITTPSSEKLKNNFRFISPAIRETYPREEECLINADDSTSAINIASVQSGMSIPVISHRPPHYPLPPYSSNRYLPTPVSTTTQSTFIGQSQHPIRTPADGKQQNPMESEVSHSHGSVDTQTSTTNQPSVISKPHSHKHLESVGQGQRKRLVKRHHRHSPITDSSGIQINGQNVMASSTETEVSGSSGSKPSSETTPSSNPSTKSVSSSSKLRPPRQVHTNTVTLATSEPTSPSRVPVPIASNLPLPSNVSAHIRTPGQTHVSTRGRLSTVAMRESSASRASTSSGLRPLSTPAYHRNTSDVHTPLTPPPLSAPPPPPIPPRTTSRLSPTHHTKTPSNPSGIPQGTKQSLLARPSSSRPSRVTSPGSRIPTGPSSRTTSQPSEASRAGRSNHMNEMSSSRRHRVSHDASVMTGSITETVYDPVPSEDGPEFSQVPPGDPSSHVQATPAPSSLNFSQEFLRLCNQHPLKTVPTDHSTPTNDPQSLMLSQLGQLTQTVTEIQASLSRFDQAEHLLDRQGPYSPTNYNYYNPRVMSNERLRGVQPQRHIVDGSSGDEVSMGSNQSSRTGSQDLYIDDDLDNMPGIVGGSNVALHAMTDDDDFDVDSIEATFLYEGHQVQGHDWRESLHGYEGEDDIDFDDDDQMMATEEEERERFLAELERYQIPTSPNQVTQL